MTDVTSMGRTPSQAVSRPVATRLLTVALAAAALAYPTHRAHAGGLEYSGAGARGLARAGAVMAKAEDPSVLADNPAGLADIQGTMMMADMQLAFMKACVEPIGYYGWGAYIGGRPSEFEDPETGETEQYDLPTYGDEDAAGYHFDKLDEVCLQHSPFTVPQLAWAQRLSRDVGIGFGFIFPAVTPSGQWGGTNGVIRGASGELRPSPVRYMQLSSSNIGAFPTLGIGYRISDILRVGLSVQWGVLSIHTRVMAQAGAGTSPNNDLVVEVRGIDWFVPAAIASVHLVPTDSLDIVAAFKAQDAVRTSGSMDITSGVFNPERDVYQDKGIPLNKIEQPLPWKASLGVRYAQRLAPRFHGDGRRRRSAEVTESVIHDPMTDELWDVELDVEYQINSLVKSTTLSAGYGASVHFEPPDPVTHEKSENKAALPEENVIEKNWKDQWVLQLGGSLNILPGVVALHSGVHYETRGVTPAYMNIDFWPLERYGVHAGFTVRLDRRLDFTFSYAHIIQETLAVAPPEHVNRNMDGFDKTVGAVSRTAPPQPLDEQPKLAPGAADGTAALAQEVTNAPMDQPPYIINSGIYRSSIDVVAVGLLYHF